METINDLPLPGSLMRSDGRRIKVTEGHQTLLLELQRALTVNSRLAAMGLDKEQLLAHWAKELNDRVTWCMETLKKKLTWRATGDPVPIKEDYIWKDCIGISCTFSAFYMRVKRGTVDERDVDLLEKFLTGDEINIPEC